ncbi:rRNA adenine N-6-methyltransferase family protein [Streptomyces sp. NPDC048442]|uniref:rRNA adenine N-6-methyltransferase family protein n=1 Tax=Streptomyces sp. NPDC048442 TaxID=3154823 RepID=UPI00343D6298
MPPSPHYAMPASACPEPLLAQKASPLLGSAPANLVAADALAQSGFATRPELGQHFLRSQRAARHLVESAELPPDAQVVEIGAGLGTLSATVAESGCRIWAVEKDVRLGAILQQSLHRFGPRARIAMTDIRKVSLADGLEPGSVLLSILPFDWELSATLLLHVFSATAKVERGLVVVPGRTLDYFDAGGTGTGGLRLSEVDGISRAEFWPKASEPLRVVTVGRF